MQRTLLALALIVTAGASYAQTAPGTDPYGRPLIGRNDFVRQPGDQPGPSGAGMSSGMTYSGGPSMATAPAAQPMPAESNKLTRNNKLERDHALGPEPVVGGTSGPRQASMKDEYGFRYDGDGNRLDARGNVISPHIPQR